MGDGQSAVEDMAVNQEFWRGKRVFVTGHTGFKGAWLSLWLSKLGANVAGYALAPATTPSAFELFGVGAGMKSVIADVRDLARLQAAVTDFKPEIVFHMAAQALVRDSYEIPVETYATNVMGTVHVLEAIRKVGGVRAAVVITTDKCYENREWHWGYREDDPLGGFDPYSNSKSCAELVTASYRNSFFHPGAYKEHGTAIATARAGNVIGGGDWAKDRLIPDLMNSFLGTRPVLIRRPHSIRPWQHVLDPLRGYLLLAERLWDDGTKYSEAWNFGPGDEDSKPVAWIADRLATLWGEGAQWSVEAAEKGPHEATYLKLDPSKARARLGWQSSWDLNSSLQNIVDWYLALRRGDDMRAITLGQIASYEAICRDQGMQRK